MKDWLFSIRYFIVVMLSLSLCACENRTPQYFLVHPEKIQSTYDRCIVSMHEIKFNQSKECAAVLQIIPIFQSYLVELLNNPGAYGLTVMDAEIKLVALQKAYALARQRRDFKQIEILKRAVTSQKLQVDGRLALIRLLHNLASVPSQYPISQSLSHGAGR